MLTERHNKTIIKKILLILLVSFLLNLMWENLHSSLYVEYRGKTITESILVRASIIDALIIFLITLPFITIPRLRKKDWIIIIIGILIAVGIELYALHTGRWSYNGYMPIIPFLSIGLTPTLQLGVLGYLAYWCSIKIWTQ